MKLPAIKKLVETADIQQLRLAEEAILSEEVPSITIEGSDEGEQLTHIMAAIFILEQMAAGLDYPTALRTYTSKVRSSIS